MKKGSFCFIVVLFSVIWIGDLELLVLMVALK